MNASDCYGITTVGRCGIRGTEYVAYYDGARHYAVLAAEYDEVDDEPRDDSEWRANAYSEWCSKCTDVERRISAAVARELGLDHIHSTDGLDAWIDADYGLYPTIRNCNFAAREDARGRHVADALAAADRGCEDCDLIGALDDLEATLKAHAESDSAEAEEACTDAEEAVAAAMLAVNEASVDE